MNQESMVAEAYNRLYFTARSVDMSPQIPSQEAFQTIYNRSIGIYQKPKVALYESLVISYNDYTEQNGLTVYKSVISDYAKKKASRVMEEMGYERFVPIIDRKYLGVLERLNKKVNSFQEYRKVKLAISEVFFYSTCLLMVFFIYETTWASFINMIVFAPISCVISLVFTNGYHTKLKGFGLIIAIYAFILCVRLLVGAF